MPRKQTARWLKRHGFTDGSWRFKDRALGRQIVELMAKRATLTAKSYAGEWERVDRQIAKLQRQRNALRA